MQVDDKHINIYVNHIAFSFRVQNTCIESTKSDSDFE